MIPKNKPACNKAYYEYCKSLGGICCIGTCGSQAADPHHFGRGGAGMKGSDYLLARVCRDCHSGVQGKRRNAFERAGDVAVWCDMLEDALEMLESWIVKQATKEIDDE